MATWPSGLGKGLQNPLQRFDSARRLTGCTFFINEPGWWNGIHEALKMPCLHGMRVRLSPRAQQVMAKMM